MQDPALPSRALSALELTLGAAVVIGHNVFHVIPNEVPILVVAGLLSMRLRDGGLSAMGLRRPESWRRVAAIAFAAAALRIALGDYVVEPLAERFWPPAEPPAGVDAITGNLWLALLALLFVWVFAAFGEEIGYHGYLMARAAGMAGGSGAAWWAGLVVTSILFGIGHWYKGPTGMLSSGIAGFLIGGAYLLSGRNLWTAILAHGFVDTVGVVVLYFGWDS